jgi:hypothetical protein
MPQPTILNLDEFRVSRSVVIGGRERILKNMTVEQFLQAGDIERKDTPREEILGLDLGQLLVLLAFIRGIDPAGDGQPGERQPGEPRAGKRGNRRAR